jgi:putative sigma-54 modulation protein
MQFQFSFKHMATSDALQSYAEDKFQEKIQKFVTKPMAAHVTFSVNRHQHTAHLSFRAGDGFSIEVEHTSSDMYASVDQMVDKLSTQLKKQKEKLKDHKQTKLSTQLETVDAEEDEVDAGDIIKLEQARRRAAGH